MVWRYMLILSTATLSALSSAGSNVTQPPVLRTPIHLMHLVNPPQRTRFPYFQGEFISELVNNRSDVLPGYEYKLSYGETGRSFDRPIGMILKTFVEQISSDPLKHMIVGPYGTKDSKVIASIATQYNLVEVVPGSSSPIMTDSELYPYFTRTRESSALRNPALLRILKFYKWNKVAIISQNVEYITPTAVAMKELLLENNMTVHSFLNFDKDPFQLMKQLRDSSARIFVVYSQSSGISSILCQAYKMNMYGPRFQWIYWNNATRGLIYNLSINRVSCTREEIAKVSSYLIMATDVRINSSYSSSVITDLGYTMDDLNERYVNWILNRPPSWLQSYDMNLLTNASLHPYEVDMLWTAARALDNSENTLNLELNRTLAQFNYNDDEMAKIIFKEITKLTFYGCSGYVYFDHMGDRQSEVYISQLSTDITDNQVGYFDLKKILTWTSDNIMTFHGGKPPKDSDTIKYMILNLNSSLFWVIISLAILLLAFCAFCIVFNVYYRETRIIKLSSPKVNAIIAIGCGCTLLFVCLLGMDNPETKGAKLLCGARIWILCSGFTFAYAGMFAKTWRVHVIFTNKKAMKKAVKDSHLYMFIAFAWAMDLVILSCWQIIDPLEVQLKKVDTRFHEDVIYKSEAYVCISGHQSYYSAVLYGYKALFLIFGIFFAWETRKVRIEALNDSKEIGICVYNVMIMSVVAVPIYQMLTLRQMDASFAVLSASVLICTITTLVLVFGSKMQTILFGGNEVDAAILPFASTLQTQHQTKSKGQEEFVSDTSGSTAMDSSSGVS